MAVAGSLTYDTKIDSSGFEKGLNKLASTSKNSLKSFTDTIEKQEKQLKELKEQYINVVAEQGKNSSTALELKNKYDSLNKELQENKEKYQKINDELDKNNKKTSTFSNGLSKLGGISKTAFSVVATGITAVTTAVAGGLAVGAKYNATIEQYATSFEVMTGSAEKATEVVEKLKKLGAETPFEMTDLADTTQLLMNYGLTADDAISKMQMLGDISQGSAEKMNRIAMAYGQMSSAGKVQLEDIKQMIDFCHVA